MESTDNRSRYESDLFRIAVIAGAALVIGVYLIATCVLVTPDGVFYITKARELAQIPWWALGAYPPGYPALVLAGHKIATLFIPTDSLMLWVYSAQAVALLCRILALVCLYFVGKILVGARRSFWAVLLLTFLPYPAEFGSDTLREWPYLLCVIGAIWLLLWSLRTGKWWGFGLIGLVTGLGFLIRPESAQLLVYAALGLVAGAGRHAIRRIPALAALTVCFIVFASPHLLAGGSFVPRQLTEVRPNRAPIITSLGGRSAGDQPLQFDVSAGQLLELDADVSDPDSDQVVLTAVTIPAGTRPVYRFEAVTADNCYLTLSENEKDALILEHVPSNYTYDGIAFYAWPDGGGDPPRKPVYGFWLSEPSWHVFTINESERETLQEEIRNDRGQGDYVPFYAYAPGNHPSDSNAVYRYEDSNGAPHWSLDPTVEAATEQPEVAWYAYAPAQLPAGVKVENRAIQWQPSLEQQGMYTLNLIASDGEVQTCQLLRINVTAFPQTPTTGTETETATPAPPRQAELRSDPPQTAPTETERARPRLWNAVYEISGAFSENLMYFLVVPLALGLYRFLKDEASPFERTLTVAIVVVNVVLMVTRYVVVEPGPHRRYCQVLVAFSLLHVPAGGQIMAHWINTAVNWLRRGRSLPLLTERSWFYILMALALGPMCLPKLLTPISNDKRDYVQVIQWLRENTRPEDIIAAPDARIQFYAEREGPLYQESPDPQTCDYIVTIVPRGTQESVPTDWKKLYSPPLAKNAPDRVTVYRPAPNGR